MPDTTSYYQDPALEAKRLGAETAQTQASAYASASALLPEKLKQAVLGKLNYNKDLLEAQNKSMAEYFVAPSAARQKYQDIFNPFEREKLVATSRAQAYEPYANLTDLLGQRMGRVEDIVQAGTGAYQSQVTASQAAADAKRKEYEDAINLAKLLTDERTTGSGGGINLLGDNTQAEPTEPRPLYTPPSVGAVSNGGEWVFTGTENYPNDWVSIYDLEAIDESQS